jgi:hypothetical protein
VTFSGSELNIEGALLADDDMLLFQRGNGAPVGERQPVDATCRIAFSTFFAYVKDAASPPPIRAVTRWDLGSIEGSGRLTFTDGAVHPSGAIAFLACAEDSPDVAHDGAVSGVAIGRIDERSETCAIAAITDELGAPLLDKAEGLAFDKASPRRAFAVTDRDDPDAPAELLELRLGAAW